MGLAASSLEEIAGRIEEALQSEGLVISRETDLEAVSDYLNSQLTGTLHVVVEADGQAEEADIPVNFGMNALGEYIIRYHSEGIEDVMTNGRTYLQTKNFQIYFSNARELFFGDKKVFLVCKPSGAPVKIDERE